MYRIKQGDSELILDLNQKIEIEPVSTTPPPPPPTNNPPVIDAGADLTMQSDTYPTTIQLQGTMIEDDGIPVVASVRWTQASGPMATIASPTSLATTITLSVPGAYVFSLTASDTVESTVDQVRIIVRAANQPPVVTAGPDVSNLMVGSSYSLLGGVVDDGISGQLNMSWSLVGGPEEPEGLSLAAPSGSIKFNKAGTYTLRLTADDGEFSVSDDVVFEVSAVAPPPNPSVGFVLGTNLLPTNIFNHSIMFADRRLNSSDWMGSQNGGWNNYNLSIGPDGMPSALPANTVALTIFPEVDDKGQYEVKWKGSGKVDIVAPPGTNVVTREANRLVFNSGGYRIDQGPSMIEVSSLPVSELSIKRTDEGDQLIDSDFAKYVDYYDGVRYMDMGNTNRAWWTGEPDIVKWSQRTPPLKWNQWGPDGIPYEQMLAIADEMNYNFVWFCVPHTADDDYVKQMATFLRDNARPDLLLYIEWSNEPWNWGFDVRSLLESDAQAQGITSFQALGRRISNMTSIFESVFSQSDMGTRVRIVVNHISSMDVTGFDQWNQIYANEFRLIMGEGLAGRVHAISTHTYFGHGAAFTSVDSIISACAAEIKALNQMFVWYKQLADEFGVEATSYEGGQHIVPGTDAAVTAAVRKAIDDPRMEQLYRSLLDGWIAAGCGTWCHFTSPGTWSEYGAFSVAQDVYNETTTPRNEAMKAYSRRLP